MTDLAIRVVDPLLTRQGSLSNWESLDLRRTRNGEGAWSVTVPASDPQARVLYDGQQAAGGWGLLFYLRDSSDPYSGGWLTGWDYDDTSGPGRFTFYGVDHMRILAGAKATRDGSTTSWTSESAPAVRTGVAETVMRGYVTDNAVADSAWQSTNVARPKLTLDKANVPPLGGVVTGKAENGSLLELLQQLAYDGGDIGFSVDYRAGQLVYSTRLARDLTSLVRVSATVKASVRAPSAGNVEAVGQLPTPSGGTATTTARYRHSQTAEDKWGQPGLAWSFTDAGSVNDVSEIDSASLQEMGARAESRSITFETFDKPQATLGVDYDLGDVVRVVTALGQYDEMVRAMQVTGNSTEGVRISATIGTPDAQPIGYSTRTRKTLLARVDRLERRK